MIRLKFTIGWHREIDATYAFTDVLLWSFIEDSAAIICACLPFLRPIFSVKQLFVSEHGRKASASVSHATRTFEPKEISNDRYGKQFQGLDADYVASRGDSDAATAIALSTTITVQSTRASECVDHDTAKESTWETTEKERTRSSITLQGQDDIV